MNNLEKNTILSFIIGDALGVPVEFKDRRTLSEDPVEDMRAFGTHNQPIGTWSDDTSMTLATIQSLITNNNTINYQDIMDNFIKWYKNKEFTPFGKVFDIGWTTSNALDEYIYSKDIEDCGGRSEKYNNGNGALMRSLPIVLSIIKKNDIDNIDKNIEIFHKISSLTHAHQISCMTCSFYAYICFELYKDNKDIIKSIQTGVDKVWAFYEKTEYNNYLSYFSRLKDISIFKKIKKPMIKSGGFVVDTLEACLWSVLNSINLTDALLIAVNLGHDTDTVGAITGSIAGFIYDIKDIPEDWINCLQKKEYLFKTIDDFSNI